MDIVWVNPWVWLCCAALGRVGSHFFNVRVCQNNFDIHSGLGCLQFFDAVGWAAEKAFGPSKLE